MPTGRLFRPLVACFLLLAIFAALAWFAAAGKSATSDEPLHLVSAWADRYYGDFRCDPEDPPLWKYWAILPTNEDQIKLPVQSPDWARMPENGGAEWPFSIATLYGPNGNNAEALLRRGRAMMLLAGVILGGLIAWWTWKLAGTAAAMIATAAYSFDPNFLGHAALVKNDVALALALLGLAIVLWRLGRRITWGDSLAAGVIFAAAINIKFSGLLLAPIAAAVLLCRALLPQPWPMFRRNLATRWRRILAIIGIGAGMAVIAWAVTWACFDFRFGPSPDPQIRLDTRQVLRIVASWDYFSHHPQQRTVHAADIADWQPGFFVRAILSAEDIHLLPQAWLVGLLFTWGTTLARYAFLCGRISVTGWWYYFPLAILFKTPLATLIAFIAAAALAGRRLWRGPPIHFETAWAICCLIVPVAIYLGFSLHSNLNIGLRHILPIYPFLYIGTGWAGAVAIRRFGRKTLLATAALGIALAVETAAAFPDYIPFFNAAFRGERLALLGDSNLDWGQDLKLLADWQRQNPNIPLYLCYFGSADPKAYGLIYADLRQGSALDAPLSLPTGPGVIAISTTYLQGIYLTPNDRQKISILTTAKPIAVLGGSIYLYQYPPVNIP